MGADVVPRAVATALGPFAHGDRGTHGVVLAVSGGRDSMALLRAAVRGARGAVRAVAVFDHGTGPHAAAAVVLVRATADALGVPVVSRIATRPGRTEAAWRDARWRFLREAAAATGAAAIATAHTADDQIETVAMRVLRRAGARGLAALAAPSASIVRPLRTVARARVAEYAERHGVRWVEDPANTDRRHLRVRLRADLLPAIERVRPGASARLLDAAARAAEWRDQTEAWVAACGDDAVRVPVAVLAECGPDALAAFWPAFAARAGIRLDRRALARLVSYTPHVVRRVRDGTVQPGWVPVAGTSDVARAEMGGGVALVPVAAPATGDRSTWQFVIRPAAPGDAPLTAAIGVAALGSSDYA